MHEIHNQIRAWIEHIHPDDLPKAKAAVKAHLAGRTPAYRLEHRFMHKDGSARWVIVHGHTIRDADGKLDRMVGTHTDITELKNAEHALRETQEQIQQIAENINEVLWMESFDTGHLLYVSPIFERVWGRSRENLYERPNSFLETVHQEDREGFKAHLEKQRRGESSETEYRIVRPDGSIRWIWDRSFPIRSGDGRIHRCAGLAQDITERKLAQEANEQLRQRNIRAAANMEAQENERRRFARELHDGLGQILTGIKFGLEAFKPIIGAADAAHAEKFTKLQDQLDIAIAEGKRIALNLMPIVLDVSGIVPALEILCKQISQQSGLPVKFGVERINGRLAANVEMGLYRIAQEALNNVVKHAEAKAAIIQLVRGAAAIRLIVADDGQGFQMEEIAKSAPGLGIMNMRARAEALNGVLCIASKPGQGTKVVVELPQQKTEAHATM